MIRFLENFLWGAATSAYQTEGDNVHADWWLWEERAGKERSGRAARHYELYERDFDLARELHHNAHRFSIEWSRIEPEEGQFSDKELTHYLDVIGALRKRGMEPVVTLHHFTNPIWLARSGGWTNRRAVEWFLRYVDFVIRALAQHVRYWITINEPMIYISHAYVLGVWPPEEQSYLKAAAVENHLVSAHVKAYRLIHQIYRELGFAAPSVGIAQNVMAFQSCTPSLKNRFAVYLRNQVHNFRFLNRVGGRKTLDFIGINYYSRQLVDLKKLGIRNLAVDVCEEGHNPVRKNSLGWDIDPEGLYELLMKFKRYGLPIFITENGICTSDDHLRWEYVREHLIHIHRAMSQGARIVGYLYWSLIDNFEWDKGFAPRFGLIEIDYRTYERTIRQSARKFAEVCKTGVLEFGS